MKNFGLFDFINFESLLLCQYWWHEDMQSWLVLQLSAPGSAQGQKEWVVAGIGQVKPELTGK